MNKIQTWIVFLLAFFLAASGAFFAAFADHDDRRGKSRHQKRERRHSEHHGHRSLPPVSNPTYTENCGACHFAYQPELLPSKSWSKILNGLAEHFGDTMALDPESETVISDYLRSNAAEFSSSELARKIMRSIGNQTPLRITEIPYIRKKHHEISQDVINRESVGSLADCSACHTAAEKGIYDDDNVTIPR